MKLWNMELEVGFQDVEDLLVCGSCQRNFPLGNIVSFVQHKKFDCADVSISGLVCQSCPQQFGTPWSLMKHAQNVHALKIYLETGPFSPDITRVSSYSEEQFATSDKSANNINCFTEVDNGKSSMEMPLSTRQSVGSSRDVTFLLKNSLSDELQVIPASSVVSGTQHQSNNSKLLQSSLCNKLLENFENVPPEEYMGQNTCLSIDSDNLQNISGDLTIQAPCSESCMENVDSMSGHSAVLEKCCSSVLPKKRKRHMEIKHASSRKRLPVVSSGPTSIYIDLEPGSEGHSFQASVSHSSIQDAVTPVESESAEMLHPSLRRRSVIIQPGMTFSIPVSRASVSLAPSVTSPLVAYTVTADGTSSYEPSSDNVSSKSIASERVTCQPMQEFSGSSTDAHLQDGLVGEEQGQGKTLEQKRRRYPTSRPFKCDQCDNAFNQRIHLKKHQSKHTGVKPFKCDHCDYSTVERSHLKVHIRVHTGEKPYKCTYCEYATAQNSTLKIHLRRHHQEPVSTDSAPSDAVYVCSKCGLQFEQHDMYQCHDAEQHTDDTRTMQSSTSVSSGQPVATGDVDNLDSFS